ncbi:hypothetical protein D8I35_07865 [Corticibacter populi]|uniref:Uncharacterized protein n=2 Tax=Corticibacter populi TaxID=1550736 RepID=A0A3M6QV48_9BURK|nr:hypothetical protein D8I35_07865 [Corticibacter populi]RZS32008.1 hypothetical protein EV687_2691 [Corticibacter populi]
MPVQPIESHLEIIMKKVLLATAVFATGLAFAGGPSSSGSEIVINGLSIQATSAIWATVSNKAEDEGYALQNIASNAGEVTINGASVQIGALRDTTVSNYADDEAYAVQSLASNLGEVTVNGASLQIVAATNSGFYNKATDNSKAVQNVSSNNACVQCVPSGKGGGKY